HTHTPPHPQHHSHKFARSHSLEPHSFSDGHVISFDSSHTHTHSAFNLSIELHSSLFHCSASTSARLSILFHSLNPLSVSLSLYLSPSISLSLSITHGPLAPEPRGCLPASGENSRHLLL